MLAYIDPGTGYTIVSAGGWLIALLLGALGAVGFWFRTVLRFLKRNMFISCCIILAALFVLSRMWNPFSGPKSVLDRRIIILGFDGMSPALVEEMLGRGKLPNFRALRDKGGYTRIGTTNPAQSPVAWSAIATGQNPGKNGVFDFLTRDPKNYSLKLALSEFRGGKPQPVIRSKTFWQRLAERKIETVLLGFPLTFPPDKITGRMLSGMGVPDILGTEGTFTFFTSEATPPSVQAGGNVVQVRSGQTMVMQLTGPKVSRGTGEGESSTVPMQVTKVPEKSNAVRVRWQDSDLELEVGKWSGWQSVGFDVGWMKSMRGIFKFYLSALEPDFKLYVSPINHDPRSPYFTISHPEEYSAELAKAVGLYATAGMPMDTWALNESRISDKAFLEQTESIFAEKKLMLDFELERTKAGVLFSYFEAPDIVQHMFWRYLVESDLHEQSPELKGTIERWYEKMDSVLGEVLAKSSANDVVIALSDHGMETFRRSAHVNSWLKENGYLVLKDPTLSEGKSLLADVDWSKTRAYSIGFGAVYLNRRGREGQGIVDAGAKSEELKAELQSKLLAWNDGPNAVVKGVYRREEIFWGPFAEESPDLYLGFQKGYRASWQTAVGAAPPSIVEDNRKAWAGDHLMDPSLVPGILFSNRTILRRQDATLYDIAPTILSLCGFSHDELNSMDLDGVALFE